MERLCYKCSKALDSSNFCKACNTDNSMMVKLEYISNSLYNKALDLSKLRDLSGAIRILNKSIKINKYNINARNLLGLIYFEIGDTVLAIRQWVISQNFSSENNDADYYLNKIRQNQGNLDKLNSAIIKYNQSIKHIQQGSVDLAIIQLKKVTSIHNRFLDAYTLLGLCYYKEGNLSKAKKTFKKVLTIDNTNYLPRKYLNLLTEDAEDIVEEADPLENLNKPIGGNLKQSNVISYIQQVGFILAGLLVGLAITMYLIMPSKIDEVESEKKSVELELESARNDLREVREDYLSEVEKSKMLENLKVDLEAEVESGKELSGELEKVLAVLHLYENDDLIGASDLLYRIDESLLVTHPIYPFIIEKKSKLSSELYEKGRTAFFRRTTEKYTEAAEYFDLTRKLEKSEDYSIEALYLMGISNYKIGNEKIALANFQEYVDKYPEGKRFKDANWYIGEIKK